MKKACIAILLLTVFLCSAQRQKHVPRVTIRGNIGIPKPLTSSMFRTSFTGVYEGNLSVNVRLFGDVYAGLGYENTHLQNNKKLFVFYQAPNIPGADLSYNTRYTGHGGFLKLGYDKFFSDIGFMSYALNTGMMYSQYSNVIPDSSAQNQPFKSSKFSSLFVQPEMSVNFVVEKSLGFSVMLSYTTLFYRFDPMAPRFNHIAQVSERRNKAPISWFNIGFGFTVLLGKE